MKITETTYAKAASNARKQQKSSAAGAFDAYLDAPADIGVDAAQSVAPVASTDALLAAQEVGDALSAPHQRAMQSGLDALDQLEHVRIALLEGTLSDAALQRVEQDIAQQKAYVTDAKLLAILDDIELRTAVERAKLEHAAGQRRAQG